MPCARILNTLSRTRSDVGRTLDLRVPRAGGRETCRRRPSCVVRPCLPPCRGRGAPCARPGFRKARGPPKPWDRAERRARAASRLRPRPVKDREAGTGRRRRGSDGSRRGRGARARLRTSRFLPSRMAIVSHVLAPWTLSTAGFDRSVVDAIDLDALLELGEIVPPTPGPWL